MDRPILFSAPMVRAILAATKTQTRRVVQCRTSIASVGSSADWNRCKAHPEMANPAIVLIDEDGRPFSIPCPYGKRGDRLWVRETWLPDPDCDDDSWDSNSCSYVEWSGCGSRIDGVPLAMRKPEHCIYREDWDGHDLVWRPSIHMPRWASRITLEISGVRVERLQDISEADARAEGIVECYGGFGLPDGSHFHAADPRESYWSLWEAINGRGSVEANPWTWVVEFRRSAAELGRRG